MANYLPIVKTLESTNISVRGLGQVVVDPATIEVGNNSVVARCRVAGSEEDMSIKCYLTSHHRSDLANTLYYHKSLRVCGFGLRVEYIDVAISRWIEGEVLDVMLHRDGCDYGAISRAFDIMALKHLQTKSIHGDIKIENIIVKPSGEMMLVDNDRLPAKCAGNCRAKDYGTSNYVHRHRQLRRTDAHTDHYPIALLSSFFAALKYSQTFLSVPCPMEEYIAIATAILSDNGDSVHYKMILGLQCSIMGRVDNLEELMREAVRQVSCEE